MKKFIRNLILLSIVSFSGIVLAGPIDVNTADAATIAENLKGVGLKKATAIIAYRKTYGPFQKLEDLANVKGIGLKTVDQNKDNILFSKSQ